MPYLKGIDIRGDQDAVLGRAEHIVAAVRNLDYELDAAVIAVSGDLAYSGGELQYVAVWEFLRDIKTQLEDTLSPRVPGAKVPVSLVAIPGNHDCDFSSPDRVRDLVLPSLLRDGCGAMDPTVVETCTRVQKPFFDALDAYATSGLGVAATAYDRRLSYQYQVPVGNKTLRLLCLNTAWLSQKHERQGELYLPADVVPGDQAGADVVVAMLHHPYNWLESNAARALRKRIEAEADIILTGHEHDATMRTQQLSTGERNTYVEGGALQTSDDPHHSVFNAFVPDLTRRKQKMLRLSWDGSRYCPLGIRQGAEDESGPPWEDLQVARLRSRGQFHLAELTHEFLDDPGVNLLLPDRTAPRLREVFVFPDLSTC